MGVESTGKAADRRLDLEDDESRAADLSGLMARYAQGDAEAFDRIFAALSPRVYGFHLRSTRDPVMAEELTQQTFLKLHVARRRYRPGAPVAPWIFSIAKNAQRDMRRRTARSRERVTDDGELPPQPDASSETGLPDVLLRDQISRAIAALPEGQRDVLLLHKFEGLSMKDVAETLGIGLSAAKVRAFRAYNALRKLLERDRR